MFLPDHVLQPAGAEAIGKWGISSGFVRSGRGFEPGKEIGHAR
jgi:hypothetical protein